ncbi:DNA-3-methyladenine glycosylase 2 family protein [Terasakiella sp. A23]|uniref:DNA-3-methyladenine glycosylase 2 family protein n=1 Tax=Terasakiella sp. FCG-A23 TaxID=3080561 RepID=UPI00295299D4|nr:DNA-3-methyladenine glycosylase 2 family protein [Terasakiella sp. A23]MDV7341166.1 DNA-3-methyladenine glycosylase 2 family protein [Terasakiella sp. A23]
MILEHDICYQALKTRDARFDGRFFTAVSSTGIFCRPICPATTPKPENCTFYPSASAALNAGFRPCLRCRPESAPASPAWLGTQALVSRAMRLIEEGALDEGQTVENLCDRLGVGERHLRRLFNEHLGASPKQVAQTRRLMFAKRLLVQTTAPITEISYASGFNSLRRFNDAYKSAFGFAPSHERKNKEETGTLNEITLRFNFRMPYDWKGLLDFFKSRALKPIEWVEEETYHRTFMLKGQKAQISVSCEAEKNRLKAVITNVAVPDLRDIAQRIRRMFDVDADPLAIAHDLSKDKVLAPVIQDHPGLRLPGAWDGFEIAVRAIIGQQISVKGARTICRRLVERVGKPCFPTAADVAETDLEGLGLTQRRIKTLKNLAQHWTDLDAGKPVEETIKDLCDLPGIGPWTAHYIVMRAFGEPDTYPVADLGLIRALEGQNVPATKADLEKRAENWRPWRAYGALYLWRLY